MPLSPLRKSSSNVSNNNSNNNNSNSNHNMNNNTSNSHNNNNNNNSNNSNNAPQRPRMNSRDIPRTYSGLFGQGSDDLMPFELARNWHTDWLERSEFLFVYLGGILVFQVLVFALLDTSKLLPLSYSWTVTNAAHCLGSIVYLHWIKGSAFDDHNDLAAMTLWEQLEGRPKTVSVKRALTIVPTLLCYAACHFENYAYDSSLLNILLWCILIFAKLPLMNGVRIFGINRTAGIDDYASKQR
eukprot:Nitzschia sp. Nitz4//NODE_389_length_21930_cov_67.393920//18676//19398//NITZ4_additional_000053-RA//-1//CDS//3329531883//1964//frame0